MYQFKVKESDVLSQEQIAKVSQSYDAEIKRLEEQLFLLNYLKSVLDAELSKSQFMEDSL